MDQTFEKRKKVIYDFIRDDHYVPMKIKEIAILLQIPGEQREELRQVLDALVEEGKISLSNGENTAVKLFSVFPAAFRPMPGASVL